MLSLNTHAMNNSTFSPLPSTTIAIQKTPTMITLSDAKRIADAAEQMAVSKGLKIVISIFDNHGNLKYLSRMDGTSVGSIQVAQLKASTSANFPVSTMDLATRSAGLPANPYSAIPEFLLLGGGLPIVDKNNEHLGSIGVSGATPELDTLCAQAGIDRFLESRAAAS